MIVFAHFALLRPWWLLALPALGLFFYLTKPGGGALAGWERAVDQPLLAAMAARGGVSGGKDVWLPAIAALVLTIFALSGPAIRVNDQGRLRNLDATLIVMDLSSDVTNVARLRATATVVSDVLDHAGTRQTGLILYAGDAYLASGLSDDRSGMIRYCLRLTIKPCRMPVSVPTALSSSPRKFWPRRRLFKAISF